LKIAKKEIRIILRHAYIENKILFTVKNMALKFERRISKSRENRSTVIVIPRPIAQSWEHYKKVDLVFDGNSLLITPANESKPLADEVA
jgi:hypothetical protein